MFKLSPQTIALKAMYLKFRLTVHLVYSPPLQLTIFRKTSQGYAQTHFQHLVKHL